MSAIGVAISPTAVFSGSVDGDWRVSLVNPQAIVHVVGRAVFAAFLKCFVATDRVMTLEQMLQLNSLHVAKDSPARNRNLQVLAFLRKLLNLVAHFKLQTQGALRLVHSIDE